MPWDSEEQKVGLPDASAFLRGRQQLRPSSGSGSACALWVASQPTSNPSMRRLCALRRWRVRLGSLPMLFAALGGRSAAGGDQRPDSRRRRLRPPCSPSNGLSHPKEGRRPPDSAPGRPALSSPGSPSPIYSHGRVIKVARNHPARTRESKERAWKRRVGEWQEER